MEKENRGVIAIVDDDPNILTVLEARLSLAGYAVRAFTRPNDALEAVRAQSFDLLISDIRMPQMSGLELLKRIKPDHPDLPIIFLTAFAAIPDAVEAIKQGAKDYIAKPFDGRELLNKVVNLIGKPGKGKDGASPAPSAQAAAPTSQGRPQPIKDILWGGKSPAMRELFDIIERVSPSEVNVLILGESGTGKERFAHIIHERSKRNGHPLVIVDCGSTPSGLLESELFGHVKGSFTHAIKDKKGLIEEANQGTLFLDEIGNISPEMQVRLLRFLESRRIRRIGDTKEIAVDCRVIAATNADLPREVARGNFREDLYYRLRVVSINIPPLRDRREDIPDLAVRFAESFCRKNGLPAVRIPQDTLDWLVRYSWPGNVRELKNSLEAGIVMCRDGVLRPSDLQIPEAERVSAESAASLGAPAPSEALTLDESEKIAIIRALEKAQWVQKEAANLLGISRRAIHYKINKYGIDIPGRKSKKTQDGQA